MNVNRKLAVGASVQHRVVLGPPTVEERTLHYCRMIEAEKGGTWSKLLRCCGGEIKVVTMVVVTVVDLDEFLRGHHYKN